MKRDRSINWHSRRQLSTHQVVTVRLSTTDGQGSPSDAIHDQSKWPKVLLAAKTYANDPLKPALTVVFCTFEDQKPGFCENSA
jgi:hypothetical protein